MRGLRSQSRSLDNSTSAVEFISYLQSLLAECPPEFRDEARMDVRALMHITADDEVSTSTSFMVGIRYPTEPPDG